MEPNIALHFEGKRKTENHETLVITMPNFPENNQKAKLSENLLSKNSSKTTYLISYFEASYAAGAIAWEPEQVAACIQGY